MQICGCCGGNTFKSFLEFGVLPRTGFYLTEWDELNVPRATLNLAYCTNCGFIRQMAEVMPNIDYAEVERSTAQQLPHYTNDIIDGLKARGVSTSDCIFEIGCNDGSFLKALKSHGFENLVGVEPSVSLSKRGAESGFRVEPVPLTPDNARMIVAKYGTADAVVCRHTLEHVPHPADLVASIALVLKPGGICVIEVPDTDWVIKHLFIHEIWDEHISYFRPTSLFGLLKRTGLNPTSLEAIRFRDTQNLVCFATNGKNDTQLESIVDQTSMVEIEGCATRWHSMVEQLHKAIVKAPKPIVAIGASHIQINFLNYAKLDREVQWMIDDDPRKTGRLAPIGHGIKIISTDDAITQLTKGTILKTAFPYPGWMDKIETAMTPKGISIIDPFKL